ncbi:hypothetical protein RhiLY_11809 [Ceratobasidium sp. AG-Ba]|nr:hypothetical protein RhiLY_11809 [Ceratobasidium sp. AG-Ba]
MPIPARIQKRLEDSMSADDSDVYDDTVSGSMEDVLNGDPALAASQVPPAADVWYIKRALKPILKRAAPDDDRSARDITPWHLLPQILNALARVELARQKVVEEATRALELNESLKKKKSTDSEGKDNVVLLSNDNKKDLRSLIHPEVGSSLRKMYMVVSHQTRAIHVYEDIRARAAGVDELILSYFPRNLTASNPHLFIHMMKAASPEEIQDYVTTRLSVYELYRKVDQWEDELKESISESVMNGLPQDGNLQFSYPEEFDKKFQPDEKWIAVLNMLLVVDLKDWDYTITFMMKLL